MFLSIEAGLVVLALALAFTVPNLGSRWFQALERSLGNLARQRGLSVVVVGLTALALRLALLPILPIPVPGIPDEFGYLLLSDTFAHGRLTNPSNPMWVHFETLLVLWQPTHTAKYWPAQGLIMALGQVLMGHPFWGVWLSVGIMCAAITWMLQGSLESGWALLGGFLTVIRFGAFNYWANSYWGGPVAAIGGALVLGALPRMKQRRCMRYGLLMGVGFAILANSRPYEGLFFGVPAAVAIFVWLWKLKRPELGPALKRAVVPLLAVLALTMVAMGYYFWRTTGNPFTPPYLVYEHAYNPVPYFPWQSPVTIPTYRHPHLRRYFLESQMPVYRSSRTVSGLAQLDLVKLILIWSYFLGPVFTLPFLLLPSALPMGFSWSDISPNTRFLLEVAGMVFLANLLLNWYFPHYSAPVASAVVALVLIAMRTIRSWEWRDQPVGKFVTRAVPTLCVLLLAIGIVFGSLLPTFRFEMLRASVLPSWCWQSPPNPGREEALQKVKQYPGRQLVIVHYSRDHIGDNNESVYNRADIGSAKVVWAQDMGPKKNEELIRYFKDRRVWLYYADELPLKLLPYTAAADRQSWTQSPMGP
jgi:hypothetical protein